MTAIAERETERVIRRFVPVVCDIKPLLEAGDLLGLGVDCETTGTNTDTDQIVEISAVPFVFNAAGRITGIGPALTYMEDPGMPIPAAATAIHGITDEMVRRKRIDDSAISELAAKAAIVVAHHAGFDRKLVEKRLPIFTSLRWACSHVDIDWRGEGFECAKLRCLMLNVANLDFDNHGSAADCYAMLHLLSSTLPSGMRALACVLDAARVSHVRVYATDSPFECKDALKARGYSWDAGAKVWHRDVVVGQEFVEEKAWLMDSAMCPSPRHVQFTARQRFSGRIGKG